MKLNYTLFLFASLSLNYKMLSMEKEKITPNLQIKDYTEIKSLGKTPTNKPKNKDEKQNFYNKMYESEKTTNHYKDIEPIIEDAKNLAQKHRLDKTSIKPFIAIAGCTAVGKSYFSEQLVKALNKEKINSKILHLDDFMDPIPVKNPLFHPHLDYVKAHKTIKDINYGNESITKPAWDLSGPEFFKIEETLNLKNVDLIIFEGEYTLCGPDSYDFLKYSSLRIFIDAKNEDLIDWNWNRNRGIKEKTKEEFSLKTTEGINKYRNNISNIIKYAQYIIFQNKEHVYTISKQDKKS